MRLRRQAWLIPYDSYGMTHNVWRNLTETAGTNNLAVVSTAAGSTFRTSFWSSTVFTGTYIFTDTAKSSWEKFISTNSEWSHCRLHWIFNKSLGDFEQKNWAFHLLSPPFDTQSLGQVYLHQIFYLQNQLGFRIHASPSNYFRGKVWLQKCDFRIDQSPTGRKEISPHD